MGNKNLIKKVLAFTAALAMMGSIVACGKADETTSSNDETTTSAQEETTADTEEEPTTEAEESKDNEESKDDKKDGSDTSKVDASYVGKETNYTKLEIIKKMYDMAGIVDINGSEKTDDTYIEAAVSWGYLPSGEKSGVDQKATSGWVLLTMYRFGMKLDDSNTESDAIQLAIEDGLIESVEELDEAEFDDESLQTLFDIVENYRNTHDFGEPTGEVTLQDGVKDFTKELKKSDVEFEDDNTVIIPSDYYDKIDPDDVILLPDGESGKAYKVTGIFNTGSSTKLAVEPASADMVYGSINISGSFDLN